MRIVSRPVYRDTYRDATSVMSMHVHMILHISAINLLCQNVISVSELLNSSLHDEYIISISIQYFTDLKLLLVIQRRGHSTKNGSPVDAMLGDTNCLCEGGR